MNFVDVMAQVMDPHMWSSMFLSGWNEMGQAAF
jgi:hypothetical protein